jgi:uncharacterized protein involved in type VI secretion and phage assembly
MRVTLALFISAMMIGVAGFAAAGAQSARGEAYYGVYRAVVAETADPEGRYRVKVKFPWLAKSNAQWAERTFPERPSSGAAYSLPRVGDEVIVAFEHGDVRRPIVLGALWNSKEKPPETEVQ